MNKNLSTAITSAFRDAEGPNLPGGAPPNQILDGIDDKLTLQVLHVF